LHEENHMLYLAVVDGRVHSIQDIENFVIKLVNGHPVRVKDLAQVRRSPAPIFNVVTADGENAVLLNIRSQPDGSTLDIANALKKQLKEFKQELPPDMKLAFFYDQSEIVRSSVESVWEAIIFGLILSVFILYFFLKNWGTTLVATLVIPVTVLITLLSMKMTGLSFNLMTLGGIAAAMLGQTATSVLEGDRVVKIRVKADSSGLDRLASLRDLPIRAPDGTLVKLSQVVDIVEEPGQLELRRDDLRQDVAVTARLEGRDMGSAMAEIRDTLNRDKSIPPGSIEYGGLYQQQQESFRNLLIVLFMAIFLVFTVLLLEFRSFYEPVAIVFGAVLAMFGTVLALWLTGTSLNVVSFLGAIIGVGIVAKNGILMLDFVKHLQAEGYNLAESLVRSGRRRLRPVLMTSMAAALGMLPLAHGIGSGADMLKPLAIAVIGALCISVLLSLVAPPTAYFILLRLKGI